MSVSCDTPCIVSATYEDMSVGNDGMILTGEPLSPLKVLTEKSAPVLFFFGTIPTLTDIRTNPCLRFDSPALHPVVPTCKHV